ncbi:hypothetical protein [Streptomyces sp. NPDC001658]
MSLTSPDAKAVVRALDALSTHVRRIADALQTPVVRYEVASDDDATTPVDTCRLVTADGEQLRVLGVGDFTDEEQGFVAEIVRAAKRKYNAEHGPDFTSPIAGRVEVRQPCPWCGDRQMIPSTQFEEHVARLHPDVRTGGPGIPVPPVEAPAADEDAQRTTRRQSIRVLLNRLNNGLPLGSDEAQLLTRHVASEITEANQWRAGRNTMKQRGEEIERDRDDLAARNAELRELLGHENKRADDAIDREETAEQAAEEQRRRADIFETELRVLRTGLRANGADPTQIQNLWAQIRLRNRQWRETKRELRLTRSMLEEEGGDVSVVDEIIATVAKAEAEAREAQAAIERVRALTVKAAQATAAGRSDYDIGRHELAVEVYTALDGTEQPTTEEQP